MERVGSIGSGPFADQLDSKRQYSMELHQPLHTTAKTTISLRSMERLRLERIRSRRYEADETPYPLVRP